MSSFFKGGGFRPTYYSKSPSYDDDGRTRARRTDPDTSHQTAQDIGKDLPNLQKLVRELFMSVWPKGLTQWEVEEHFKDHNSTYRSRVPELAEKGVLRDTGERRTLEDMGLDYDEEGFPRKGRRKQRIVWVYNR
jgi:hypothetical protein